MYVGKGWVAWNDFLKGNAGNQRLGCGLMMVMHSRKVLIPEEDALAAGSSFMSSLAIDEFTHQ